MCMLDDLISLKAAYKRVEELSSSFYEEHHYDVLQLVERYCKATGGYIDNKLGEVTDIVDDEVYIENTGYEGSYSVAYPLELFTNPCFIEGLEALKAEKDRIRRENYEESQRQEYLRLKQKYD